MPLELFDLKDENDNFRNLNKNQPAFSPYYEKGFSIFLDIKSNFFFNFVVNMFGNR